MAELSIAMAKNVLENQFAFYSSEFYVPLPTIIIVNMTYASPCRLNGSHPDVFSNSYKVHLSVKRNNTFNYLLFL
jgi:hypothetical protein